MKLHPGIRIILTTTATAMGLSSCALKDGRLDFTWWQDAAAPVLEDDVIIEAGGGGYYRSTPAPAQIPQASIPKAEPHQPETPRTTGEQAVAQQQPATQPPPARPATRPTAKPATPGIYVVQPGDTLTAIAGSIAEGFYGVPNDLKTECRNRLSTDLLAVLERFEQFSAYCPM